MNLSEIQVVSPEIVLASMACFILLWDVYFGKNRLHITYFLTQLTLVMVFILLWSTKNETSMIVFTNQFVMDPLSNVLKSFIFAYGILGFMYSKSYICGDRSFGGEFYILSLFSILGMMILVSSLSFLTLYLGIELLTLPLYALIAMAKHDRQAPEAAMKYFVMGAIASGMLLFGISLLYGNVGSVEMKSIANYFLHVDLTSNLSILCGMVFIIAGLSFKLGAVPFHLWIPDVYQGAPAAVTLFISTLPKLAGFGMAIRILHDTFAPLTGQWQPILALLAVLSLGLGNIAALVQNNLKRLLGYSAIGHMGFVFSALLLGNEAGYSAGLVYMVIYALMALAAFGIIVVLSHKGFEAENVSDFKGLGSTQPLLAAMMLILLFSLAGVPPTVGFYAKFIVLDALINAGFVWLAILAVLFSVIGAFYYLRIIKVMYFESTEASISYSTTATDQLLVSFSGALILGLGIYPGPLINLCLSAFSQLG